MPSLFSVTGRRVVKAMRIKSGILTALALLALGSAAAYAQQDRGDPKYQAGYREGFQVDEPEDKGLDALERVKKRGKLIACADPYAYPYSDKENEPPGFDIEIVREIAKRAGLRYQIFWTDTGTRGGLGRALRQSIMVGQCDVFLGLAMGGDEDEELQEKKLTFTAPFMGLGYILVVRGAAADAKSLAELKQKNIKIGVDMSTPSDAFLFDNEIPRELFFGSRRNLEGLLDGKVEASLVWLTTLAVVKRDHPDAKLAVAQGYTPEKELRWNGAFAVKQKDVQLKKFLDESLESMVKDGAIKRIVESYGIPYYPPFS